MRKSRFFPAHETVNVLPRLPKYLRAARSSLACQIMPRGAADGVVMEMWTTQQPYLMLVDDDAHSARLLTRMLLAHGAPSIQWIESSSEGLSQIKDLLGEAGKHLPGLVIVDLKSSSTAARDFIAEIAGLERSRSLVIAAMAPSLDRDMRDGLLDAGADAVFERHAELQAYRAEAAAIVSFWVRNQRLDAVGT
jgi:CheY-like chemotaxis protein